jgi:hypothetical protein
MIQTRYISRNIKNPTSWYFLNSNTPMNQHSKKQKRNRATARRGAVRDTAIHHLEVFEYIQWMHHHAPKKSDSSLLGVFFFVFVKVIVAAASTTMSKKRKKRIFAWSSLSREACG